MPAPHHGRARRVLGAVCLVFALATGVRAGDVPNSALSQSLLLSPMFVDYSSLLFRYPQSIASNDSLPLAFGHVTPASALLASTDFSAFAIGGTLRNRHGGVFVLSQEAPLVLGRYESRDATLLQAGLGAGAHGLRAGGAFRALRSSGENGGTYSRPGSTEIHLDQLIVTHYEAAFGAGITARDATADVVVEWTEESYKRAGIDLSPSDTLGLRLNSDSQDDITVAARVAVPLGSRARAVAIGSYRSGDRIWDGDLLKDDRVRYLLRTASMQRWSAGLSVAMAAPHVDCVAVSGFYDRSYEPQLYYAGSAGLATDEVHIERGTLTLSCQRRLWQQLVGNAGVSATYLKTRRDYRAEYGQSNSTRQDIDHRETTSQELAVGVMYAWRNFDVAATVNPNLTFNRLLGIVDLHIKL